MRYRLNMAQKRREVSTTMKKEKILYARWMRKGMSTE